MPKQCRQCGDVFYTELSNRQFCSRDCIALNLETPMKSPKKQDRRVAPLGEHCFLCDKLVNEKVLETVSWHGKYHDVCQECFFELENRVEEEAVSYDFISATLGAE